MNTVRFVTGAVAIAGLSCAALLLWSTFRPGCCGEADDVTSSSDASRDDSGPDPIYLNGFVSDPKLLLRTRYEIKVVIVGADGKVGDSLPYLVLLDDGRWAAGLTDHQTNATRSVFTDRPTAFSVYCCDEAYRFTDAWNVDAAVAPTVENRCAIVAEPSKGDGVPMVAQCRFW